MLASEATLLSDQASPGILSSMLANAYLAIERSARAGDRTVVINTPVLQTAMSDQLTIDGFTVSTPTNPLNLTVGWS
jgi:hypothetical protein